MSATKSEKDVRFVVGNTYDRIADTNAAWNRKKTYKKVHDWTLFVDIVHGDPDLIQKVKFDLDKSFIPHTYVCSSPVKKTLPDGSSVSRFGTRQQSTGSFVATVRLVGRGGSVLSVQHPISLKKGGKRQPPSGFLEVRPLLPLKMNKISEEDFGVELELSTIRGRSHEAVAHTIRSRAGVPVKIIMNYSEVHNPVQGWKLVHDGSIECNRSQPDCTKFELVSPVLRGGDGLNQCSNVLAALRTIEDSVKVNKSMGFHVHVSVENMPLHSLIKFCQNYIKYEDAIDSFMPPSRRTGSRESNLYFKSNKDAVVGPNASNLERHKAIAACENVRELCNLMCPTGRYYKLNMQNLATDRQPTVEFRQHSATSNYDKVNSWVRFCITMVKNSARLPSPSCLKNSRGADEQFTMLFEYVIKDRALRNAFSQRRKEVITNANESNGSGAAAGACCSGCASGSGCARR